MREEIIEFETPASRVIKQFSGKDEEQFKIPADLPDLAFKRRLSIQGRLWFEQAESAVTATGLITRVPPEGSTDFIYMLTAAASGVALTGYIVTLNNDDMTRFSGFQESTAGTAVVPIVDSLVGDGRKAWTVDVTETASSFIRISLFGWVENTSRIRDIAI